MGDYTTIGEPVCVGGKAMERIRADKETGKRLYRCHASARKGKINGRSTCMYEGYSHPAVLIDLRD